MSYKYESATENAFIEAINAKEHLKGEAQIMYGLLAVAAAIGELAETLENERMGSTKAIADALESISDRII